jgi:hypothetical protein
MCGHQLTTDCQLFFLGFLHFQKHKKNAANVQIVNVKEKLKAIFFLLTPTLAVHGVLKLASPKPKKC